jgi:citrate lyase beta subunit
VVFEVHDVLENCRLVVHGGGQAGDADLPVARLRAEDFQVALDWIVGEGAGSLLLADCRGVEDLQRCDVALSVAEARAGCEAGHVRIVAGVDSAAGVTQVAALGGKSARLAGLAWNGRAFADDMTCAADSAIVDHARMQVMIAARAFGLPAYLLAGQSLSPCVPPDNSPSSEEIG